MRPTNKNYTASAKSLALAKGPSRAASVVPLLSLEKLENLSPIQQQQRPYSADYVALRNDLPSCELLKQMLSEPIRSWRNDENIIETTSMVSLVSGGYEKTNNSELVPGLTSKPPSGRDANRTDTEKIEKSPQESSDEEVVMLKNWLSEEKEIESEILLSERRTDRYLDDLKKGEETTTTTTTSSSTPPPPPTTTNVEMLECNKNISRYGDVLGSLDDLMEENSESVGRQSSSSGIVEDNGTYDDIIALLKVLEEQDKKSRNFC